MRFLLESGLRVNRRMAREFGGDSARMRRASVAEVSRALGISLSRWNSAERQAFGNWSLVLALIPDLSRWTLQEKQSVSRPFARKRARMRCGICD